MQETAKYKLQKPDENDYADISVLNANADKIEKALTDKPDTVELPGEIKTAVQAGTLTAKDLGAVSDADKGKANGVAGLGADGKVPAEQLPEMDYAPASHATDKNNPHKVTAAQVGAPTAEAFTAHTGDGVKHITAGERTAWNGKASAADIGNMHVWKRTQVISEGIVAGYTLGEEKKINVFKQLSYGSGTIYGTVQYASAISVDENGNISLVNPSTYSSMRLNAYVTGGANWANSTLQEKFCIFSVSNSNYEAVSGIWYIPTGATFTEDHSYVSKAQTVTGYPAIAAGTHIDYLTSTNRNAYQEGSDAKPAGYTLGEIITGEFAVGRPDTAFGHIYQTVDTIKVSEAGVVSADMNIGTFEICEDTRPSASDVVSAFAGKFVILSKYHYMPTNPPDNKPPFDSVPSEFVYIPEDVSCGTNSNGDMYINKYQPVYPYPAIPANTTIEYLGQIGDKTQIHFGSYVGTGKYNKSNSTRIAFPFSPQWVFIFFRAPSANKSIVKDPVLAIFDRTINPTNDGTTIKWSPNSTAIVHVTWESDKTISFYSTEDANKQLNSGGYIYHYVAIS